MWAGFVPPGLHTVVVKGLDDNIYQRNYAVSIRERDIGNVKLLDTNLENKNM